MKSKLILLCLCLAGCQSNSSEIVVGNKEHPVHITCFAGSGATLDADAANGVDKEDNQFSFIDKRTGDFVEASGPCVITYKL
jgi:hypothetical protein